MITQITVDKFTKEVVERLSKITDCSESCIYSFGIKLVCHQINKNSDKLFEDLYTYFEYYYKQKNKQGGHKNEEKKKISPSTSVKENLFEPWRLQTLSDKCNCQSQEECPNPDWVVGDM